ncbi:DUF2537 domain-containing protein [Rhodococcus pyridinivorans]|uniref:DUF2537 domain-containing protein n=1 Tax=Rhodococcus TaxID=1827 RepID=UPI0007EADD67|nr:MULTISPECIES: DUF2537 domain-containing protein [Rhodococcus]OBA32214.1 hypothetical protein A5767_17110 [Rhodococcus sp. 852002-51564_SCH6189132-a]UPW03460.1 DUF2537 domain-containing protein [Rhodococcus pyridinivorans]USI91092.1 DUF2537 domain-containing protein [Rhodococcus pyridinivorans]UTM38055.1 DUF2537 domain-containing protein [Rhodococcus pyridinivorans]
MSQARGPAPTPWATGLTLTALSFVATVITVVACGQVLGRIHPVLAVVVNVVTVAGVAPTVWSWLRVQVLRWLAAGFLAGVPFGWLALLVS